MKEFIVTIVIPALMAGILAPVIVKFLKKKFSKMWK